MKLTVGRVRSLALPAGKSEIIYFDDEVPGFGLRIREGGSRTFVFQYKLGKKQRRLALGGAIDVVKTRETARDLQAKVRLGGDPAGDKAESRARVGETFGAAIAPFLEHQKARLRPRSYPDVERHLLKHAKCLHGLPLAKTTKRDIASCITAVARNSGAVAANRVRSSLSSCFGWLMGQGLIEHNPVIGTPRNQERSRERVLSPEELRLIWTALGDDHYGVILKLLALT